MQDYLCLNWLMLLWAEAGWVVGPLLGCLISTVCHVAVSLVTGGQFAQRVRSA